MKIRITYRPETLCSRNLQQNCFNLLPARCRVMVLFGTKISEQFEHNSDSHLVQTVVSEVFRKKSNTETNARADLLLASTAEAQPLQIQAEFGCSARIRVKSTEANQTKVT